MFADSILSPFWNKEILHVSCVFSCESELIPVKSLYNFQEIPAIQMGPKCGEISYQQMYTRPSPQLASINKLKFPRAEEFSIIIAKQQLHQPTTTLVL
jgi:hypothetical protein